MKYLIILYIDGLNVVLESIKQFWITAQQTTTIVYQILKRTKDHKYQVFDHVHTMVPCFRDQTSLERSLHY